MVIEINRNLNYVTAPNPLQDCLSRLTGKMVIKIFVFKCTTDSRNYDHTVQMFHMTSASGVFEVSEVLNPSRTEDDDICTLMPFLQEDLYAASQPGELHCVGRDFITSF